MVRRITTILLYITCAVFLAILLVLPWTLHSYSKTQTQQPQPQNTSTINLKEIQWKVPYLNMEPIYRKVILGVPHVNQIPNSNWNPPWNNACEEATVASVDQFYLGNHSAEVSDERAMALMSPYFTWLEQTYGTAVDSNADRTAHLINAIGNYSAKVIRNPSVEQIIAQINSGHPVISFHYGHDMHNPLHRFRQGGSSYHVMAIIGYDERAQEFITQDPELHELRFRYDYEVFMNSLHDFDHNTRRVDGPPTVILTSSK